MMYMCISVQELPPDEIKDLNRGRAYLANVADRHGVTVYQSIDAALNEVVTQVKLKREHREQLNALATTRDEGDLSQREDEAALDSPPSESPQDNEQEQSSRSSLDLTQLPLGSISDEPVSQFRVPRRHGPRMSTVSAISSVSSMPGDDESDDDAAYQTSTQQLGGKEVPVLGKPKRQHRDSRMTDAFLASIDPVPEDHEAERDHEHTEN
jgi:hypothetical protein